MTDYIDPSKFKMPVPNPANSDRKIDDLEMLKQKAAQRAAEIQEKKKEFAEKIKKVIDKTGKKAEPFKKEIVAKYKKDLVGILILPPKPEKGAAPGAMPKVSDKADIVVIVDIDETNPKDFLKRKQTLDKKIHDIATKKLSGTHVELLLVKQLWDSCLKGKYDYLGLIASGFAIYDTGWVGAMRATEIHKMKVLQKFEKYVVSYVIAGSMVRGDATETSDIDTYVIIDDTDVTRMTSSELKSRLQSIIIGFSAEASLAAGVKNKLNIQVYVLTDMWDSLRNANPVIFTLLRDGVPLYDRGVFAPWKLLLRKGKLKPSPEAIDSYLKSGDAVLKRTRRTLKEIAIEDFFWATITPSQGALMLMGVPPPTHKELAGALREHFVKKKLLEEKYVKLWEKIFAVRKDVEHGRKKEVSANEVAELLEAVETYQARLKKLFTQIEKTNIKNGVAELYEKTIEDSTAALAMVSCAATKANLIKKFKSELVEKKLAPSRYLKILKRVIELKEKADTTREEIATLNFEQDKLIKDIYNIIRAEKGKKVEKFKLACQYAGGQKTAGVWLLTDAAYIIKDVTKPNTPIHKYQIDKTGALINPQQVNLREVENAIRRFVGTPTTMTKNTIESLKKILHADVKIVIGA